MTTRQQQKLNSDIAKLRAFRSVGEEFEFHNITFIVEGLAEYVEGPKKPRLEAALVTKYKDAMGVLHRESFPLHMLEHLKEINKDKDSTVTATFPPELSPEVSTEPTTEDLTPTPTKEATKEKEKPNVKKPLSIERLLGRKTPEPATLDMDLSSAQKELDISQSESKLLPDDPQLDETDVPMLSVTSHNPIDNPAAVAAAMALDSTIPPANKPVAEFTRLKDSYTLEEMEHCFNAAIRMGLKYRKTVPIKRKFAEYISREEYLKK